MNEPVDILLETLLTEKASALSANLNQYVFKVNPKADRRRIADAVERVFGVTVARVNVLHVKPKLKRDRRRGNRLGRKSGMKKAIVTLKEGDSIDLM